MRQSKLFTKTFRSISDTESSLNARILIRAGFIAREMAGAYIFLPLGLRVLRNIINIIRLHMDAMGAQELLMTSLQRSQIWMKTNRWNDEVVDVWFKTKGKNNRLLGLAPTHEEPLAFLMRKYISSWKDLPIYVYQFQTKFRNELRAKSGLLRGREFLMKDLYSFHTDKADLNEFYERVRQTYNRIFKEVGLGDITYYTYASGGSFSKYSNEFQTICNAGEDYIYIDEERKIAINKEVYTSKTLNELGLLKKKLKRVKTAEVGNIFKLGTKFSVPLDLYYLDKNNQKVPVIMGSYGIGVSRLMAVIAEIFNDEKGLIWPESVAPFKYHILIQPGSSKVAEYAEQLYYKMTDKGIEVLLDDRDVSLGTKMQDADLIGCPYRVIVSLKSIKAGGVELKARKKNDVNIVGIDYLLRD